MVHGYIQKDTHNWSCKCLILSEIRPALANSEESPGIFNKHLEKIRI